MIAVSVDIGLTPELTVMVRVQVLYHVVRELTEGLGGRNVAELIEKGVVRRQLLESIRFNYLDANRRIVAFAEIAIDWQRHAVNTQTLNGATLEMAVGDDLSIAEQVSKLYRTISDHVAQMWTELGVHSLELHFVIRRDIAKDQTRLQEARSFLGVVPAETLQWADRARDKADVQYASEKLDELSISLQYYIP